VKAKNCLASAVIWRIGSAGSRSSRKPKSSPRNNGFHRIVVAAGGPAATERPFAVTRTVTGVIAEVKDDGRMLVVTDKKGNNHEFKADARMKMKGGDKMMKDDKMTKDRAATQVTLIAAKK
jgi:hypothetical protein